ncbi:stemmadenine O-acetyltransferase-like [Andrographis paniculata]|uniref:stemmadenine O-acetyltransferase-like n=1 Tax=Andrographis paniculata TaxID=175694 RepID=UPI0021E7B0B8|nr:stemmadenine O-acetyltransferase-like [Andrographis paniculata]
MDCTVQIISRDIIRPSAPTPDHLKTHKLSILDQLAAPVYISLVFFYHRNSSNHDPAAVCRRLRQSLSKTLAVFYPLAGKIDPENFAVDCDDTGAEFVEARAGARLADLLRDPQMEILQKLLPIDPLGGVYAGDGPIVAVQVNFFDCGGMAVAACAAHKVVDNDSLLDFLTTWAAICRGGEAPESRRKFGAVARHFPARDLSDHDISPALFLADDSLVTKRFIFDKDKISFLRNSARSETVKDPTRVESLSAFVWKHFLDKKLSIPPPLDCGGRETAFNGVHVVNIRSRADPSLQFNEAFGNACFLTQAVGGAAAGDGDAPPQLFDLAARLRRAIRKVDAEYVSETETRFLAEMEELSQAVESGEVEGVLFSSWCRFPVYEVDYGWGIPDWVCTTVLLLRNLAILMNSRSGEEIELWINLPPAEVDSFAGDFLRIGSAN